MAVDYGRAFDFTYELEMELDRIRALQIGRGSKFFASTPIRSVPIPVALCNSNRNRSGLKVVLKHRNADGLIDSISGNLIAFVEVALGEL
jgi:hypothetical protein